jgi:hypothetical protein
LKPGVVLSVPWYGLSFHVLLLSYFFVTCLLLCSFVFLLSEHRTQLENRKQHRTQAGHRTQPERNTNALKRSRGFYATKGVGESPLNSYAGMKEKLKMSQAECVELRKEVGEMRRQTGDVSGDFKEIRSALDDSEREISKLKGSIEVLGDEKKKVDRQIAMFRLRIENLKGTITTSSDAYDALVEKVERIEINFAETEGNKHKRIRRSVCGAFGWCEETADPQLLSAACGFWQGCSMLDLDGVDRKGFKSRQEI